MPLHLTKQLSRAIQDDPSKCVLFVGAGLSASGVRQGGRGLPDWDILMQHMIDDLRDSEKCDAATLAKHEESLGEGKHLAGRTFHPTGRTFHSTGRTFHKDGRGMDIYSSGFHLSFELWHLDLYYLCSMRVKITT